jgi:uracil-DNA glycosylase
MNKEEFVKSSLLSAKNKFKKDPVLTNIFIKNLEKHDIISKIYDLYYKDEEFKEDNQIYPILPNIFKVFLNLIEKDISVVILGQDPYYTTIKRNGKEIPYATGLAFGIPDNAIHPIPPSLVNILKESKSKLQDRTLNTWVDQGVMLLNTSLTVEKGKPESHLEIWKLFIEDVISDISVTIPGVIFVLWGNHAKSFKKCINKNTSYILESSHPSPLSAHRGFIGCNHFKSINKILKSMNKKEIIW